MALLEYENEIFLDCFHDDGLLVMAKGLGIERIFMAFLKLYSDEGNLVLVLNTTSSEEEYFTEQLEMSAVKPLPKIVNANCSVTDRQSVYLSGGVLFITTRILVVDMLVERIPIHLISGILIYRANRVVDSCQEAFILRLYRQKNKTGFIKAFSENPLCFTSGFCQVERVMRSLFVRKLFLWPRFHASVVAFLEKHKIDVVELHLQMTEAMTACQTALLDLIDACVKELKHSNPVLDTEEISVEFAITKNFDKLLRMQLDPIGHQLSFKTKQIVADLKTLRLVLEFLTQYDCVNFYSMVNSLKSSEKAFGSNAGWLFMDSAESLFTHSKERLHPAEDEPLKKKKSKSSKDDDAAMGRCIEECPKWRALKDVMDEIDEDCRTVGTELQSVRILVAAEDDRTCSQLKSYLCEGGQSLLTRLYDRNVAVKKTALQPPSIDCPSPERSKTSRAKKKIGNNNNNNSADLTLTQMVGATKDDRSTTSETDAANAPRSTASDFVETCSTAYRVKDSPLTFLHPLHEADDPNSLKRVLYELQPRYVVLYDVDMAFVRQLEVFKACHPQLPIRVYFLMYTGSTEEQRYLTTLRKEKEAFEYLIKQKATMVIPEEREGRMEDDPTLSRNAAPANATVNTRKGDAASNNVVQKVIVDMREFRSELPSLLHRRGIDIEPVTLEVGDYILTRDICVERKSVSDLIGSLNNGRLYNQCLSMCRSYKRPVLLIEFDPNKPFTLQDKSPLSREINRNDTISHLVLLTLHFPRLRILWCPSPHITAELFEELKVGREQPDAKDAIAVSSDSEIEKNIGRFNSAPQDMLLKMPGVTSKNVFLIMNQVENIVELSRMSLEKLVEVLGSSANAELLHSFLHKEQLSGEVTTAGKLSIQPAKQKTKRLPLKKSAIASEKISK